MAAVSGGADSAALLYVLHALSLREGFFLAAAHVDHGLREESAEDARFVSELCKQLRVPCQVHRVQITEKGEDGARKARYAALLTACEAEDIPVLALAHHRRDQAETVLLHLFRGSGGSGLAGMAPLRAESGVTLWRPFLNVSPDTLRKILLGQGIPWREDASNADPRYLRNYLRHTVLPAVERRFPRAEEALARTALILRDEEDCWNQETDRFLKKNACLEAPCRWIAREALRSLHPALQRRAIRRACPVAPDHGKTEKMLRLAPGETVNLPEGWRAFCSDAYLHFLSPRDESAPISALEALPFIGDPGNGKRLQAMPEAVFLSCEIRAWRAGDRIRPLGATGSKSLQDYFTDRHIDRPFRRHIPLLCRGRQVIWAVGVGPGEEARVTPGAKAVLLHYSGFLPGMTGGMALINTKGESTDEQQRHPLQ